jgi:hypothetical protein
MRVRWLRLAHSTRKSRRPLSFEHLEDRLTPSWGSIPPSIIAPPSNASGVSFDGQGDATGDTSIVSNEVDWYRFVAPASGSYVFTALTPLSTLDTVAAVYASTGGRIAYNDDISTANTDSRFTANLVFGRTYYFGVTNYNGTPGGAYTWKIDGPSSAPPPPPPTGGDDGYEENDSRGTPYNFNTLSSVRTINNLVMADGHDWYRFNTSNAGGASHSVTINFQHAQGDLDVELYNFAGSRLRTSATTGNTETISLSGLGAGTYFIHVLGYQGAANPNYSMTITPPGSAPPPPPTTGGYDITLITTGLTSTQAAIFEQAAQKWEGIITAALPAATYNGMTTTGVIINASSVTIDGRGGVLGRAGPDRFRSGSSLPYHGSMQFDTADMAALQSSGGLLYTVLHEMGHVLGVGTLWRTRGLVVGAGTTNPVFTGTRALQEYNALFRRNATGVPVENTGGSGTRDAHWRESTFRNELMTGFLNSGVNPLSRITVASMADLGYTVDMSRADAYAPPASGLTGGSGSGGGGGAALRALPASVAQDLLRRIASDVVTAMTSRSSPVQTLVQETRKLANPEPLPSATPAIHEVVREAAKRADDVFSIAGLRTGLTTDLLA